MADKIVEITREKVGRSRIAVRVVLLYGPIDPIEIDGQAVILTPSDGLDALVLGYDLLSEPEKTALDTGVGFFLQRAYTQGQQESVNDLLERVRSQYAVEGATFLAEAQIRYEHTGRRHSAT